MYLPHEHLEHVQNEIHEIMRYLRDNNYILAFEKAQEADDYIEFKIAHMKNTVNES